MQEGFLGEMKMFAGNFAPRSWAFCQGQLLSINQNQALFSILGTTYGGDGRTSFGLPDLRGRVPIGAGNGPGLSDRRLGAKGGSETNILNVTQIPAHSHTGLMKVADQNGNTHNASDGYLGRRALDVDANPVQSVEMYVDAGAATFAENRKLDGLTLNNTGGNQPIYNSQPMIVMNYIIATQGVFPSRS